MGHGLIDGREHQQTAAEDDGADNALGQGSTFDVVSATAVLDGARAQAAEE